MGRDDASADVRVCLTVGTFADSCTPGGTSPRGCLRQLCRTDRGNLRLSSSTFTGAGDTRSSERGLALNSKQHAPGRQTLAASPMARSNRLQDN